MTRREPVTQPASFEAKYLTRPRDVLRCPQPAEGDDAAEEREGLWIGEELRVLVGRDPAREHRIYADPVRRKGDRHVANQRVVARLRGAVGDLAPRRHPLARDRGHAHDVPSARLPHLPRDGLAGQEEPSDVRLAGVVPVLRGEVEVILEDDVIFPLKTGPC